METIGMFRTRVARDGAIEVWAKGWRLESQVPALVPVVIAVGFLFSPFAFAVRGIGAAMLLACSIVVLRMSRLGFRVDVAGVQVIDVTRTRRVTWERFNGFVGERNEHEGRCVLLTTLGERVRSPGTLDPDEMDPFWAEGDVSAVDQLNRLVSRLRGALTDGPAVSAATVSAVAVAEATIADVAIADVAIAGAPSPASDEDASPGARRLRSLSGR